MPLEGQWERTNTPLRRLEPRERRVAIWAAIAVALTIVILIAATVGSTRPKPGPGCIRANIPHVMGAEELNLCGRHARRACARHSKLDDPGSRAIQESCRTARLARR
jgi:hypothetical protein